MIENGSSFVPGFSSRLYKSKRLEPGDTYQSQLHVRKRGSEPPDSAPGLGVQKARDIHDG